MPAKKLRFILGVAVLFSSFIFTGQETPSGAATSCFDCAMENVGFVDIYNRSDLIPAYIEFEDNNGNYFSNISVDPSGYRSFNMPRGRYGWRAWWVDPILRLPHEWDWGWVYIKPGSRAVIDLVPKKTT
jgi:hypothetical protein